MTVHVTRIVVRVGTFQELEETLQLLGAEHPALTGARLFNIIKQHPDFLDGSDPIDEEIEDKYKVEETKFVKRTGRFIIKRIDEAGASITWRFESLFVILPNDNRFKIKWEPNHFDYLIEVSLKEHLTLEELL